MLTFNRTSTRIYYRCSERDTVESAYSQLAQFRKFAVIHWESSTPGGDRTPDLLVRSQALCPAELRAHLEDVDAKIPKVCPTIPWTMLILQGIGGEGC
jgi:hypothetical protein